MKEFSETKPVVKELPPTLPHPEGKIKPIIDQEKADSILKKLCEVDGHGDTELHPIEDDNGEHTGDREKPLPTIPLEKADSIFQHLALSVEDVEEQEGYSDNETESRNIDKTDEVENEKDSEDNADLEEECDDKELTEEEINEKQKAAIKEAFERIKNGEKLTNQELGNLGEMMMDQYYISKGYKPLNKHRVTSLDDKKAGFKTGIDGVYEKTNPDGTKSYVIVDAKYNTSQLSETNDGKQMSDNWIDKRLDDAVGKEKADEIRDVAEDNPDSVKHEVYHIDPNVDENGNIHTDTQEVDSDGNKVGDKTIVEYYDEEGNRIDDSSEE